MILKSIFSLNHWKVRDCFGVRGHVRALERGDMSPRAKAATCRRTPKTATRFFTRERRFMESLDLQNWTRIGTMNRSRSAIFFLAPIGGEGWGEGAAQDNLRFMERGKELSYSPQPPAFHRKYRKTILSFLLLSGLAVGCTVGPNYHQPEANAPTHWKEPMAGGETNISAVVTAWWKNFHDPELDSLVERAVRSNLDLRIAQARVREERAQYGITSADLWPTLNGSGSYSRARESKNQPVLGSIPLPPGVPFENNVYQAGFDASWEIDVFGGRRRAVQAAGAKVSASEFGRRDVLVTLLGDVARNYVELRGYQGRLAIARENIEAQERALAITRDRFAKGLATDLDVQQAATVLATTRAEVPTFESSIQTEMHRLEVLMGQQPGTLEAELVEASPIPAQPPQVPVGLPSELLLRRPDVRRAERELAAATANIGVAKSDLFPKFFLTGAAGFQSVSASDWFTGGSKFWSFGPTVQWRIFDAGRIRSNIKVQNARQEEALAKYEKTVLTAFEEVENGLTLYAKEQLRRRSLQDAVTSSQRSLDLANKLYANGLSDFLRVLDAERSLYQAQDALVQSDRTISDNLILLYKSLGGGWETMEQPSSLALAQTSK